MSRVANGVNQQGVWPKLWTGGPGEWVRDARCGETDPELFFPDKGGSSARAKLVCLRCEVISQCLAYALTASPVVEGIWGGTSERQRQALRRGESA